jgi:hypothetical protein
MKRAAIAVGVALLLGACGSTSAPEKQQTVANPPLPPPVKDDKALLLTENLQTAMVVQNHLLDKKELPGGTLGQYEANGKKYQMFIIETSSSQDAAILLLDLKNTLKDAEYIAYMGGYSGTDADKPFYTFAKLQYVAGIVGLVKDKADPLARELAARLR